MMAILVAALMWSLVLILMLRAKQRPDNTLLWSAGVIAVSMTTNIELIYLWASTWLPPNALDLWANLLLVVGVGYLASAIRRGASAAGMAREGEANRTRAAAVVTILVMVLAFSRIDAPEPSTTFMLDYGDQLAAGLYSAVQYVFIGGVMLGTLATCVRNVPRMIQPRFRIGFTLTGAGCAAALALCLSVVIMDVSHVAGQLELMRSLGYVYDYLFVATMGLLCGGLSVPPLVRQVQVMQRLRKIRAIEPEVHRLWTATVAQTPSVSLVGSGRHVRTSPSRGPSQATERLHRMVVEIHDCLNVHGEAADRVSSADWKHLQDAETLCLRKGDAS
ncbi:DUF6545 domain-containing protein [Citricoccus sp. I39-566]|uniref:DUF6545 domain-containing protein n=1 Tax=Citricoccus sp. I39-566 TaxID=3073268 RepID=UPI00286A51F2|nr:DUF6545 domain-containing protein [Citricoccus sp. I39-566]WMY80060.1 hypothetical protein RE421_16730 [Citricoccus sp. I39-566]